MRTFSIVHIVLGHTCLAIKILGHRLLRHLVDGLLLIYLLKAIITIISGLSWHWQRRPLIVGKLMGVGCSLRMFLIFRLMMLLMMVMNTNSGLLVASAASFISSTPVFLASLDFPASLVITIASFVQIAVGIGLGLCEHVSV